MADTYKLYSSLPSPQSPALHTAAEISIPSLLSNYRLLLQYVRKSNPDTRPICVVKADAYGHGADKVAAALAEAGCDFFAVSCIEEGMALRRAVGQKPDILVLGYTPPECAKTLAEFNIVQTIISKPYALELCRAAKSAAVRVRTHLKLDTGMNRLGVAAQTENQIKDAANLATELRITPELRLEGIFTHFARADEGSPDSGGDRANRYGSSLSVNGHSDEAEMFKKTEQGGIHQTLCDSDLSGAEFTAVQFKRFMSVCSLLEERGIHILRHISNSAAAFLYPEYTLDCVRFGIMLYGLAASDAAFLPGLLPVMKLRSIIAHTHVISSGSSVGYGGIFKSDGPKKIATVPVGYADGFIRAYTGAKVTVLHGKDAFKVPIVGRICMDQLTLDVTGTPAEPEDTVILFGDRPGSLELLASRAVTIAYESACIISSRVPRYYIY